MEKTISSYEAFLVIKNMIGLENLVNELSVHKGTIKRWEQQKSIPKNYDLDLSKLIAKIEFNYSNVDLVRIKSSDLTNERKYDEFYTTTKTAKYCFNVLINKLKELELDINNYNFIEPSAGAGSFYNVMPKNKRIGIEINPNINEKYIVSNYLDFFPKKNKKYIVLGNPPFGLRGNLALRFINHSYEFADIVAFILPPLFDSDGKGSPKKRVEGYELMHSEKLPLESFEYPNGKKVKVSTYFQIWTKINTHLIKKVKFKTANSFIKIYSLSDGGTPGSTRNKEMIDKCDIYLPSTCFKGMKVYKSFSELPNKRGYGIKILKNKRDIKTIIVNTNWENVAFLSTNCALNLRMSLITKIITDAGFYDMEVK
ncbi:hypothetical protein [Spiroplasma sp. SV19]|uniref:hypothetical protein n=1 Tax=Spiroplasma sp. SV19 TaxID=2570468 RepID=UPI0024B7920A|nr:hypothetical protein [Spiroplasma sp. SV19]WHQ36399.1 SAM-dependent methyltransferase [Spiroplasma sp. SV19]